ncbi:MAG: tRNA epoxyqueuosine(34) reductase QueG [Bacteroidales bacterium]
MQEIIKQISDLSSNLGFVDFGIAKAGELTYETEHYNHALDEGYFAGMTYLSKNIQKRFNPQLLVEGARSVLVFLAPYGEALPLPLPDNSVDHLPKGVALYSLGEDYHTVIKNKLHLILARIQEFTNTSGRIFTDSAPILERAWAVKAGLGFIGKNNFLISRKTGIRTIIGIIVTEIELPATENKPQKSYCGTCTRCLDACPSGALCAPYRLDARKCISYHTIENDRLSDMITNHLPLPNFNGQYFGCDACMNACPWNRKNRPGWPEFLTRQQLLAEATPQWWEKLSAEEFKKLFATSPLLRAGLKNIRAANRLALQNIDSLSESNSENYK